jgi:hypothetical protein
MTTTQVQGTITDLAYQRAQQMGLGPLGIECAGVCYEVMQLNTGSGPEEVVFPFGVNGRVSTGTQVLVDVRETGCNLVGCNATHLIQTALYWDQGGGWVPVPALN